MSGLSISGIIVDIILFFIIAGNATIGYRRGLTRVIFSICSSIIAIILVFILYKPTTNYIIQHTKASQKLESAFAENLQFLFEKDEPENTQDMQNNHTINSMLKVFIGDEMGNLIEETTDSVVQYMSVQISHKIISVIVFFALFTIIRLLLYIIRNYIELVANLPIIRVVNGSGGMVYGIIRGFFIIYITFALLSLIMPIVGNTIITEAIQKSLIGSKMFNHNIILNLIFKFL